MVERPALSNNSDWQQKENLSEEVKAFMEKLEKAEKDFEGRII